MTGSKGTEILASPSGRNLVFVKNLFPATTASTFRDLTSQKKRTHCYFKKFDLGVSRHLNFDKRSEAAAFSTV